MVSLVIGRRRSEPGPRDMAGVGPAQDPASIELGKDGHDVLAARAGRVAEGGRRERLASRQGQRPAFERPIGRGGVGEVWLQHDDAPGPLELADRRPAGMPRIAPPRSARGERRRPAPPRVGPSRRPGPGPGDARRAAIRAARSRGRRGRDARPGRAGRRVRPPPWLPPPDRWIPVAAGLGRRWIAPRSAIPCRRSRRRPRNPRRRRRRRRPPGPGRVRWRRGGRAGRPRSRADRPPRPRARADPGARPTGDGARSRVVARRRGPSRRRSARCRTSDGAPVGRPPPPRSGSTAGAIADDSPVGQVERVATAPTDGRRRSPPSRGGRARASGREEPPGAGRGSGRSARPPGRPSARSRDEGRGHPRRPG